MHSACLKFIMGLATANQNAVFNYYTLKFLHEIGSWTLNDWLQKSLFAFEVQISSKWSNLKKGFLSPSSIFAVKVPTNQLLYRISTQASLANLAFEKLISIDEVFKALLTIHLWRVESLGKNMFYFSTLLPSYAYMYESLMRKKLYQDECDQ